MESNKKFIPDPGLKLMDQVRKVLRYHHYAYRTEQIYCDWIVLYIKYFGAKQHPRDMGKPEIEAFLTNLAVKKQVPETYTHVMEKDISSVWSLLDSI